MIKKLLLTASAIGAMLGTFALTAPANAKVIGGKFIVGDSVVLAGINIPNIGPFKRCGGTIVANDPTETRDAFVMTDGWLTFRVEPSDTSIVITLLDIYDPNNPTIGGFAVSSNSSQATEIKLYYPWTPDIVTGASITNNIGYAPGLVSDVSFTDKSVSVALWREGAANWSIGKSLTINLTTTPRP